MKTKKLKHFIISAFALTLILAGCKKDNPEPTPSGSSPSGYSSGVFIVCEGPFGSGTGTVSYYNRSTGAVNNDIFETANGYPLGNIVQSMNSHNNKGYIVVNNANKVQVVNLTDFKSTDEITGVNMPRYFIPIDNNKAYVTEWVDGFSGNVKVIDLSDNTVTGTISTGKGAEKMVKSGSGVYVTCKGAYDNDSVVIVINSGTDAVIDTLVVGPNPDGIEIDANGKIWVLCAGQWNIDFTALAKSGRLVRINPSTNAIEASFDFTSLFSMPQNLTINAAKNKLYFTYQGGIYTHDISSSNLNNTAYINRSFYGLGIDPATDYIYGADAGNFSSNGWVIRYNNSGSKVDSFQVGIIPNGFHFK